MLLDKNGAVLEKRAESGFAVRMQAVKHWEGDGRAGQLRGDDQQAIRARSKEGGIDERDGEEKLGSARGEGVVKW